MRARGLTGVIAFVLAAAATIGVFLYVHGVKDNNKTTAGNVTTVIVSKQDIPAGTKLDDLISGGGLTTLQVPSNAVVPGAVTEVSQLQGRTTSSFILHGEQITTARLQGETAFRTGGVLGIPKGYEAVTVQLEAQRVVNNVIQTGDHVVVYATSNQGGSGSASATATGTQTGSPTTGTQEQVTVKAHGSIFPGETLTVVPDVKVLQVVAPGSSTSGLSSSSSSSDNTLVTLALKPHDAAEVIAAQAQGYVWFALLPPQGHGVPQGPVFIGG
jgi:pilus assembly protein CpaB